MLAFDESTAKSSESQATHGASPTKELCVGQPALVPAHPPPRVVEGPDTPLISATTVPPLPNLPPQHQQSDMNGFLETDTLMMQVRRLQAHREDYLKSLQEWESILFDETLNQWLVEVSCVSHLLPSEAHSLHQACVFSEIRLFRVTPAAKAVLCCLTVHARECV